MNVLMQELADRQREQAIEMEKQLRRIMAEKNLTQQQLIEQYTRVEWTTLERAKFGAVNSIQFHSAIVPNELVDSFLVGLENEIQYDRDYSALVLGV